MSKIYDCFSFFNELDLLEIRLNELDSVVDHFVLMEATKTFQGKPKPLYFEQNKERFAKFLPKIIHVVVDDFPTFWTRFRTPKTWDFERNQRNHAIKALKNCAPDDVIILGDIDEIPVPEKVLEFKDKPGLKVFRQRLYWYFLNCFVADYNEPIALSADGTYKPWHGTVMVHFKDYTNFEDLRTARNSPKTKNRILIEEGGWHYSWLGGVEKVLQKLEAYSHKENNRAEMKDPAFIKKSIESGADIFGMGIKTQIVDPNFKAPKYLVKNMDKFSGYVLKGDQ